jgi:uncharacterized membrane protein
MTALILITALGCGLASGAFFVFSTFIMPALDRLAPDQGIAAMQSINRLAVTPAFMTLLFGTALLCLAAIAWALLAWDRPQARWMAPAGAVYLIGCIGVTIAANVPRNDALEKLDPAAASSAARWAAYVSEWTAFNHVRTLAALIAAGLLTYALTLEDQPSG